MWIFNAISSDESARWLALLLDAALKGLAILSIAGLASLLLHRSSAAMRHMVWSLAAASLLAMPVFSLALPQFQLSILPAWAAGSPSARVAGILPARAEGVTPSSECVAGIPLGGPKGLPACNESVSPSSSQFSVVSSLKQQQKDAGETPSPHADKPLGPPSGMSAIHAGETPATQTLAAPALLAWLVGALVMLAPPLAGSLMIRRRARRATAVTDPQWLALLRAGRERLGVRRAVTLLQSRSSEIPMTWGLRRPAILLPADADTWTDDRRMIVLLHELAHVKRADCMTQLLAHLTRALYWFNPLAYVVGRAMRVERERACDDLVLASGFKPSDYAGHLLEIVRGLGLNSCPSMAAIAMARKSQIEGRLSYILDAKRNRRSLTRAGMLLAATLIVALTVSISVMRATAADKQAKPAPATQPAQATNANTSQPAKADTDAEVPWGKAVDGMACRIIVPKECVPGASIPMAIEVKNISDRKRYIVDLGKIINPDYWVNSEYSTLTISDSQDANKTPWASSKGRTIPPMWIIPIEPKEIKRISLDLNSLSFHSSMFRTPGEYRLTFSFTSPKPERGVVGSKPGKAVPVNMPGGGKGKGMAMVSEPIYADPTKEQLAGAWTATIESTAVIRVRELMPKELTVHEWGVFSSFNDAKYANANLKREWASMPNFFYHQFPTRRMRFQPAYINAAKPIIYFYTDQSKLDLNVKVSFSDGAPVVWWPCARSPVDLDEGAVPGRPHRQPELFRAVEWVGCLGGTTVPAKTVQDSWINQARIEGPATFTTTDATRTTDLRHHNMSMRAPQVSESERFLYYDGLMPATDYIRCSDVAADSLTIQSSAGFAIANLILVDRRDPKVVRFARVEKIEAGRKIKVALEKVPSDWPTDIRKTFNQDLLNAGLYDKEADSVLKIWEKGLFDRPGITAIYLLPQSEYDRMLPLTVSPQPGKVVRVGIALHGQLEMTPTLVAARVKELVAKMNDDNYRVRDKASHDLIDLGPVAFPAIREALKNNPSPEVRSRLEDILKQFDATEYLKPALDALDKGKEKK